jgi:hypothetical protein
MSYHHSHQLPVVGAGGGIEPTFFNPRVPPPIPQLMQQEIGTQYSTTSASIAHSTLDQPRQSISHSEQQPWYILLCF